MNAGECMAMALIAFVVWVLIRMWCDCILRPCKWEHQFDVPKVEMPMETFGVYQCAHCKRMATGSPRWIEGF